MRKIGDVLHPERESLETLNAIKIALGSYDYYAQYQQCPVPPEGAILQRDWFPIYDEIPQRRRGDRIFQSWDTALTDGKSSDYRLYISGQGRRLLHTRCSARKVELHRSPTPQLSELARLGRRATNN
jgi:hypothetical protein